MNSCSTRHLATSELVDLSLQAAVNQENYGSVAQLSRQCNVHRRVVYAIRASAFACLAKTFSTPKASTTVNVTAGHVARCVIALYMVGRCSIWSIVDGDDEQRAVPRDEMETIEIGAVLVRSATLEVETEFQTFVRPFRHATLTPFCTELTGITQEMLADAPAFPEAMEALRQAMLVGRWGVVWGSWGLFDDTQLRRDCAYHGIDYPMPEHMNLKNVFPRRRGDASGMGCRRRSASAA